MRSVALLAFLAVFLSACDDSPRRSSTRTRTIVSTQTIYNIEWLTEGEEYVSTMISREFKGAHKVIVECGSLQADRAECEATLQRRDGGDCNGHFTLYVSGPHTFDRSRTTGTTTCTTLSGFDSP
jgi:hypothetical protein